MKREIREFEELRYRISRYQAMGNGAMCQHLNMKLRKLMAEKQQLNIH
jgi:hypothetical protein